MADAPMKTDALSSRLSSGWAALAVLFIAAQAVNLTTLGNGFVYDDEFMILGNPWTRDLSHLGEIFTSSMWGFRPGADSNYYRPLAHLIFMAEYALFGLSPFGYHLANSLVHGLNTCLVFFISMRLLSYTGRTEAETGPVALAAGLIFASHPVHVEAIAPASVIAELSLAFFYLLSFYAYALSKGRGSLLIALSALAFLAAIFLKETAVTIIGVIALFDLLVASRIRGVRSAASALLGYAPYAAAFAVYMAARLNAFGALVPDKQGEYLSAAQVWLNVLPLLGDYARLLFAPYGLKAFYTFSPALSLGDIWPRAVPAALAAAAAAYLFLKRRRVALFACLWTLAALSPALYIPGVGARGNAFAERYLYIPSAGFALAAAMLLYAASKAASRRRAGLAALAAASAVSVVFGIASLGRNTVWKDNYTLWKDTASKSPDSAVVYINLGSAAHGAGRLGEALEAYDRAAALSPYAPELHNNIGMLRMEARDYDRALESFERAYNMTGNFSYIAVIKANMGDAYMMKGMAEEAVREYEEALRHKPGDERIARLIEAARKGVR